MNGASDQDRVRRQRWRVAIVGVLLAGAAAVATIVNLGAAETARFCTADGRTDYPDASRDPSQECQWVDDDGNLIPELTGL